VATEWNRRGQWRTFPRVSVLVFSGRLKDSERSVRTQRLTRRGTGRTATATALVSAYLALANIDQCFLQNVTTGHTISPDGYDVGR